MIIYLAADDNYYALCGPACRDMTRRFLEDPTTLIKPTLDHDDSPYCCWFCGLAIDPETWGTKIDVPATRAS